MGVTPLSSRGRLSSVAVLLVLVACRDPDPHCPTIEGQVPGKLTLSECTDGHRREIDCSRPDPKEDWGCGCMHDDHLGATFNWPAEGHVKDAKDPRELELFLLRQCGWSISAK